MKGKELRWKQRFVNFEKAFHLLERTLDIENPSEAEKGGLIHFYETCFELAWKSMRDYLENEGYEVKSPRQTIKQAFQIELIADGELWLNALEDRNQTEHIYDELIIDQIISKIRNVNFKLLNTLFLFFKLNYE